MIYSKIAGTGRYLPERIMTNADLEKIVDTSDEWIRTRTGVERRHVAAEDDLERLAERKPGGDQVQSPQGHFTLHVLLDLPHSIGQAGKVFRSEGFG